MDSPAVFYTKCVKKYHDRANELGYAKKGVIAIPELTVLGSQAVLWFYQNDEIQRQSKDPVDYYYTAVNSAISCGILFGEQWHTDYSVMKAQNYAIKAM